MPNYNQLGDSELVKQRQKWIDNYNNIWIDTRFVNQIDVDGETDPNLETPYFESVTKKKKHYFVKGFCGFSKKRAPTKWDDVELLCGQGSYASKKSMVYCSEKEMIDYCGRVQEVLTKDSEQTVNSNRSNTNLNPNISQSLNEIFTTRVSGNQIIMIIRGVWCLYPRETSNVLFLIHQRFIHVSNVICLLEKRVVSRNATLVAKRKSMLRRMLQHGSRLEITSNYQIMKKMSIMIQFKNLLMNIVVNMI